jgi:hypothetical protein
MIKGDKFEMLLQLRSGASFVCLTFVVAAGPAMLITCTLLPRPRHLKSTQPAAQNQLLSRGLHHRKLDARSPRNWWSYA